MDIQAYIKSGVIESYVLGIADAQEAAELESLSRQYPEIAAAIEEFERTLEANARAHAVPVTDTLKDELVHSLKDDFREKTVSPAPRIALSRYIAAASLILLLASIATNIYLYRKYTAMNESYTSLLQERDILLADNKNFQTRMNTMHQDIRVISAPGIIKVMMPGVPGKDENMVALFWNTSTKEVYVHPHVLPKAPAGKQYQLWALVDGKPVDAGMLADCESLCRLKNVTHAQAFAITLEKTGGSPTPTMDQMYVIGKVGS